MATVVLTRHSSSTLRAAQALRDFLTPINTGVVPVEMLDLPTRAQLPVRNGQCLLDDLRLHGFVRQQWWQNFWRRLEQHVSDYAGQPTSEKLVASSTVAGSASSRTHKFGIQG